MKKNALNNLRNLLTNALALTNNPDATAAELTEAVQQCGQQCGELESPTDELDADAPETTQPGDSNAATLTQAAMATSGGENTDDQSAAQSDATAEGNATPQQPAV
ncbi:MAG: hypothetical protein NT034_00310 [Candidatus Magasanikbacteria bacterium]|nr:hypothetical protein [Candidatus Magasanikbacteria bacterium]